ncbi:TetR/AcrR family transcriptional regulator [Serinibacter salmoneus]|uniref:TetR/AcrR family transcriptional regulator n=1 Tax=Serinibacter salmoneus TaxID=556530 RepID=UPI001473DC12|nr:TetR/AcrR family transcriptional regulator [Serinibacter salmoneus]
MTQGGLRERKKAERREALGHAARTLVAQESLDGVTVEAICARVGVSPRTFFNYYETKEDAVLGLGVDSAPPEDSEARRAFAAGGPTGDLLTDAATVLAESFEGWLPPGEMECLVGLLSREPRLLARHVGWMERGRESMQRLVVEREQVLPTGTHPVVTVSLVGVLIRISGELCRESGSGSPTQFLPEAVRQVRAAARA